MAEPVGTALGALGVCGLLTVCLDCFNLIQDGISLGKDFVLVEGQFSALRMRLYAWGHACGFMSERGYDRRLDNPAWKQHVQKQLNCISLLFLDAAKIVKTYELAERYDHQAGGPVGPNAQFIDEGLQSFLVRIRRTKKKAGLFGSLKWALVDKKRFTELVKQLKECVEALELVSKNLNLFEEEKRMVEYEIDLISDVDTLQSMISAEPAAIASDVVSDAASLRILRINRSPTQHRSLGLSTMAVSRDVSTGGAFFTAPSKAEPNKEQALIEDPEEGDEDLLNATQLKASATWWKNATKYDRTLAFDIVVKEILDIPMGICPYAALYNDPADFVKSLDRQLHFSAKPGQEPAAAIDGKGGVTKNDTTFAHRLALGLVTKVSAQYPSTTAGLAVRAVLLEILKVKPYCGFPQSVYTPVTRPSLIGPVEEDDDNAHDLERGILCLTPELRRQHERVTARHLEVHMKKIEMNKREEDITIFGQHTDKMVTWRKTLVNEMNSPYDLLNGSSWVINTRTSKFILDVLDKLAYQILEILTAPTLKSLPRRKTQNALVMESVLKADSATSIISKLEEKGWGRMLERLKKKDVGSNHAFSGPSSLYRRLERQAESVRRDHPYMTARIVGPANDDVANRLFTCRLRASFEGPPQSPYRGGIFHLIFEYSIIG
jgi:hypothetical protein